MLRASRFPLRRLCPVLETPGFVVSTPLAGAPFRRRRLGIENFVSLAGVVGRKGWFATSLLPIFCQRVRKDASSDGMPESASGAPFRRPRFRWLRSH